MVQDQEQGSLTRFRKPDHEGGPRRGYGPGMEPAFLGRRAPIFVVELTTKQGWLLGGVARTIPEA
jgi:hypothetical protein